jgi:hypothetical protein
MLSRTKIPHAIEAIERAHAANIADLLPAKPKLIALSRVAEAILAQTPSTASSA